MEPNIKVGETILIKNENKYKKGDIITYKYKNTYVTHRVVKIDKDSIITKGDANNTVDEAIKKSDVIGKMVTKLRVLSFINYLIGLPYVWILVLIIGIIKIILLPTYKRKNGKIIDNEII